MYWPKSSSSEEANVIKALQNHILTGFGSLAPIIWYFELPLKIKFLSESQVLSEKCSNVLLLYYSGREVGRGHLQRSLPTQSTVRLYDFVIL